MQDGSSGMALLEEVRGSVEWVIWNGINGRMLWDGSARRVICGTGCLEQVVRDGDCVTGSTSDGQDKRWWWCWPEQAPAHWG